MEVTILCTDPDHPVVPYLWEWIKERWDTNIIFDKSDLTEGDILFLVSCSQIIKDSNYKRVLVLHASDLPLGRGWSPHIWDIVNGSNKITVCLLEAKDPIDTGNVLKRESFTLEGHELLDEINDKLFKVELSLMDYAVNMGTPQTGEMTYWEKRTPEDSEIDVNKSIAEQFNLLRVVDNERYPAFFKYLGFTYEISIKKK